MIVDYDFFKGQSWDDIREDAAVIVVSGGFDPLHIGHLKYIQDARSAHEQTLAYDQGELSFYCILIAVVNGDQFLHEKKGYAFMPANERLQIIDGLRGVDYTFEWNPKQPEEGYYYDMTVCGALELIKPHVFAKGGDRVEGNVPEDKACREMGIEIIYGVGGEKIQSSSQLIEDSYDSLHDE